MDGSQYSHYFWDGNKGQQQVGPFIDSASVSDDPRLFTNSPADYAEPAVFFAQPVQPLDLPLVVDGLPALTHQPSGPTQWDEHAVQPRWEDFSSSSQAGLARTPSTGPSSRDLFDDGFGVDPLVADISDGYPSSRFSSAPPSSSPEADDWSTRCVLFLAQFRQHHQFSTATRVEIVRNLFVVVADPEELLSFGSRIFYAQFIR
ncbi:hypothetical protein B0H19DRAFT_192257 [Mycena capillaripes]|nr:hypothetical protein B0H19DRAFT_192257 [Mycena capillaripes]